MGWRFRRRVRIMPGLWLNVSKSGISTPIGGRGAALNLARRGTRTTVGLPGSGLSYRSSLWPWSARASAAGSPSPGAGRAMLWLAIVAVVVIVLALSACVASGVKVEERQLAQFQRGKTTYTDVVAALGVPTATAVTADGARVANYTYTQAQARPESFIPIIGPLVGGADAKSTAVTFQFDRAGILISYTSASSQIGTGMGAAAGSGTARADQPRAATNAPPNPSPATAPPAAATPTAASASPRPDAPRLGIKAWDTPAQVASAVNLSPPRGAMVLVVDPGSVAEKAGIKTGDIILAYNGSPVQTVGALLGALADTPAGATVKITYWRNGAEHQVEITFAAGM